MFESRRQADVFIISGNVPLDCEQQPKLQELLDQCFDTTPPKVVLDMQKIPLVDGSGLELLLDVRDTCEMRGGGIKLSGPNALCREIFTICGLNADFDVYQDVKSAIGSFAK